MANVNVPGVRAPGISLLRQLGGNAPAQIAIFVAAAGAFALLGANLTQNMARVGLQPGFGFLWRPANFSIGESLIDYTSQDSFGRAIFVGILNTLLVSGLGCILATVVGVSVGLARLSTNRLLAGLARGFVELVRNTPLLLQLFVWNATLHALPATRQALSPLPGVMLSNRGLFLPSLHATVGWGPVLAALALLVCLALMLLRRVPPAHRRLRLAIGLAPVIVGVGVTAALLLTGSIGVDVPEHRGFNITGGISLTPEFTALLVGLTINSAAGIAEIVRGGIEAIPHGQWDAARALGLSRTGTLRLVVLPQVLRLIIPVMTSSYLSLVKNSSLAVAIGYPDIVNIANTIANQSGQALEAIAIMAVVYLTISIAVSAAMNAYNARLYSIGVR
jgi:general L-amino acid transport system permease protein